MSTRYPVQQVPNTLVHQLQSIEKQNFFVPVHTTAFDRQSPANHRSRMRIADEKLWYILQIMKL